MYIYKTTNLITGKIYVGQSSRTVFTENYKGSGKLLWRSINKHGIENFKVELLEDGFTTKDGLNKAEIKWIATLDACNLEVGYNLAAGGHNNTLSGNHIIRTKQLKERKVSLQLVNIETGISRAKEISLARATSMSQINPETGLNKFQESSKKAVTTRLKINPETGLQYSKEISQRRSITMEQINPETGLNKFQETGIKISTNRKQINPETGLSIAQEAGIRASITKIKINSETGLSIAQEAALKFSARRHQINPETGLSIAQEAGKKISSSKKGKPTHNVFRILIKNNKIIKIKHMSMKNIQSYLDEGYSIDKSDKWFK